MSNMIDKRAQMTKQLQEFERRIAAFGARADAVETPALKRAQERLVTLVDMMDAQLKVWQIAMIKANIKSNQAKTNGDAIDHSAEITELWNSMQGHVQEWLTMIAALRMIVGADAMWQLEALGILNATASDKLRALEGRLNGNEAVLQEDAEQALADLKHALQRVRLD